MLYNIRRVLGFIVLAGFLLLGHTARADCSGALSDFDNGICQAENFGPVDASLNQTYEQLYATLSPDGQLTLRHEELAWLKRRDGDCATSLNGGFFIDFDCVTRMTLARTLVLKDRLDASVAPLPYGGQYTVPGSAMPWLWNANGLNSAYSFGLQDGTGPVVLALSKLDGEAGETITIKYLSGEVDVGGIFPPGDANGVDSPYSYGGDGSSGQPFPSQYMQAYPINLGALVGVFTDESGSIVNQPFSIGDGPVSKTIPAGASQLQLGINDDIYGNTNGAANTGSFIVSVVVNSSSDTLANAQKIHGCAVFGASVQNICQNYPSWSVGYWQPPKGVSMVRVLVVGGGGGGCANLVRGMGGPGGGSGKVVTAGMPVSSSPIKVVVGQPGLGALAFQLPGSDGEASSFGDVIANGGGGGQPQIGGSSSGIGGNNGGGGSGGGNYEMGFHAGAGGDGGTGGNAGKSGQPGTDAQNPVQGTYGGPGSLFPVFNFVGVTVSPGPGGPGGAYGYGGAGCDGGGGGGGGGVLLNKTGPDAKTGDNHPNINNCGIVKGQSGHGGIGYGAGGGGAGNGMSGPGGDGAPGLVYIEW